MAKKGGAPTTEASLSDLYFFGGVGDFLGHMCLWLKQNPVYIPLQALKLRMMCCAELRHMMEGSTSAGSVSAQLQLL